MRRPYFPYFSIVSLYLVFITNHMAIITYTIEKCQGFWQLIYVNDKYFSKFANSTGKHIYTPMVEKPFLRQWRYIYIALSSQLRK